jgi:hypothetical protein
MDQIVRLSARLDEKSVAVATQAIEAGTSSFVLIFYF